MPLFVPLPASVRYKVGQNTNPSLLLDKYVRSWDPDADAGKLSERVQKPTVEEVSSMSQKPPAGLDFVRLLDRWASMLRALDAKPFQCVTTGPLTLHLTRASALENSGICLHPLYGFVFLPSSGLKGMAHAFACECWLPAQADKVAAWREICHVFGWAPSSWLRDLAKQLAEQLGVALAVPSNAATGSVVFHDAWPHEKWPRLIVDIVNNHHLAYYQDKPDSNDHPPGDWENPVPVYFLAVAPGTTFTFAVSKRRADADDWSVECARDWLLGGLCHSGAGAKTSAGYGCFRPSGAEQTSPASARAVWTGAVAPEIRRSEAIVRLRLITPAFLGGPKRDAEATPRLTGIKSALRRWWRGWHGHLTAKDLRQREAEVFGSIATGAALSVLFPPQFPKLKVLPSGQNMGPGGSPLGYLGYGLIAYAKGSRANLTQIKALDAGQSFDVRLAHTTSRGLADVVRSFWLFGALGGLGSRSRRGWGSVWIESDLHYPGLPNLSSSASAEQYRERLLDGLEQLAPLANRKSAADLWWTAISRDTQIVLSPTTFNSWREAMEDLGRKFIAFRSCDKRGTASNPPGSDYEATKNLLQGTAPVPTSLPERSAFGLPYAQQYRSLGGRRATFTPEWREGNKKIEGRRASPIICKIVPLAGGKFLWQVAFLPSRFLPANSVVRAEHTDTQPASALANSPFPSPGAFGVLRSSATPQDTLLKDFLDWLEGRYRGVATAPRAPTVKTTLSSPLKPTAKPINKGQTRKGTLKRQDDTWIAVFDEREALISNPDKVPSGTADGTTAEVYIEAASKKGIRARFEKLR
ncbi:MAG: type III-B CRISPR module RAMP protein Cmr6 [Nitrospiraceae bacterium]|nr:type III-B CRISPR module RAMP protein Cmr6 [Nitrospiraceae bacterium]